MSGNTKSTNNSTDYGMRGWAKLLLAGLLVAIGPAEAFIIVVPSSCSVSVEKSCLVAAPVSVDYACHKSIDALTMIWNGPQGPGETVTVKAYKGSTSDELLDVIPGIKVGDEVTVSGYAGSPNNVIWEIFDASGNKLGESIFHLSCSDKGMDGADDCGMAEGDGKDGNASFLNNWLLEGIVDAGGFLTAWPMNRSQVLKPVKLPAGRANSVPSGLRQSVYVTMPVPIAAHPATLRMPESGPAPTRAPPGRQCRSSSAMRMGTA